jgi:TatD DNase family protein
MLIDSHAHLDMKNFDRDRDEVLKRASDGGIARIITIGIDHDSSLNAVAIAGKYDFVYAAVACHPHKASECNINGLEKLVEMTSEKKVVAWGEIGLDFYRRYSDPEDQSKIFLRQLEMAKEVDLPVIIHDREAHKEVFAILTKMGKGERKGVIHCFSGDVDLALAFIELGYYISIPGTVTYKNASQVRNVAANIPLERVLIETDAPFLAPVPRRGKRNEPLFVGFTAKEIARLRNIQFEEVARVTSENARILFGLP